MSQASYDLRRLRLKGLIERLPHSNTYLLTSDGVRVAVFYTKVHNRVLVPLLAANTPPAPPDLQQALRIIDQHVTKYVTHAPDTNLKTRLNCRSPRKLLNNAKSALRAGL